MKLKEIEIFNFKSIEHEKITIDRNQLCLIGKNECGKTSILEAISYLNFVDYEMTSKLTNKKSESYPSGYPTISGTFDLSQTEFESLLKIIFSDEQSPKNNSLKLLLPYSFDSVPKSSTNSLINIKRWGNGIKNIQITLSDLQTYSVSILDRIANPVIFCDNFYNNFLPIIEFFDDEELLLESATVEELLSSDKKFETFRRFLTIGGCTNYSLLQNDNPEFAATIISKTEDILNEIFKKHYKQDNSISFKIMFGQGNKLSVVIRDSSKQSFSIDDRSPGLRYYFSFLINRLYSTKIHGERNQIYLLDEPGNNLHPKGAKDLLKTFDDITKTSQILYTTHNPFLTIRNDVDSLYFVNKTIDKGTKVQRKSYLNKYQIIRKELGILLNDSFLIGDLNLIVEGNTEKLAFHRFFQNEKYQELEWLNIYNADGVGNISQAMNYLGHKNLNLKGIVFLDSDDQAEDEKKKKGYIEGIKSTSWESIEINDAFQEKKIKRTFEDLFPQQLYIECFNEYCHSLKEYNTFDKEYTDFIFKPIDTPIIDTLESHYKSFFNEENRKGKSITKQDIIRILLDKVDKMDLEEQDKVFSDCYKVLDKILASFKQLNIDANN